MSKKKVGIIGCGNISAAYMKNIPGFAHLELVACADIDLDRAKARAEEFQIPHAYTVQELLNDPSIDIVINLTIPAAHAEVCIQVLEAGKHVYVEKPLAVTREEGTRILEIARSKELLVGSAPDTFLGGGIQTCVKLIQDGWIGTPIAATAFMMGKGHEHWHPDPEFYYAKGGGPMFDMGPYYLTALVALLGPIRRVTGSTGVSFPERTIKSEKKRGQKITVETPTHIAGVLDFHSGAIATLVTSFDIMGGTQLPNIEIYGSHGSLRVPDPNTFGGQVMIRKNGSDWEPIPLSHGYKDNSRGLGVAAMAQALITGEREAHRANGDLAYHVLEAMHGFHDASDTGQHYVMKSSCEKPLPLAPDSVL
ncbi:Gfo/Idh/MocA family protein [Paenibacillus sp. GCM10023248]|uniref:Gfo/Idh/MocA family protein n=1 Tax=unclassified Paenibacillus TaxID=185978 RepID=UPI002378BB79|nr:Gfo/Idh/MocA family oxidoreductase [Paenibacillus sp. MAHUQ-63]MDD9271182.1 Gfo/Idh/MocA family oxidoreductase [Paenibacillus sp. MAHUQ-63]